MSFLAESPEARIKMMQHLDEMMRIDRELYERILDTPNFAYHFNEICNLARTGVVEGTARHLLKLQLDYDLEKRRQKGDPL
jgi:hypothetical protein